MARVAQGGNNPGQQTASDRWQHPNAQPPSENSPWVQDTQWGHVAGGGPKIRTPRADDPVEEEVPVRRMRDDLLPRDKKKNFGAHAGHRSMRRRKRPTKTKDA